MDNSTIENNIDDKQPKSNNLIRKTKKELVDIIFRKDDIERNLRKNINTINKECETINDKYNKNKKLLFSQYNTYNKLKDDYESICDEYASYRTIVKTKLRRKNYIIYSLFLICIILVINLL